MDLEKIGREYVDKKNSGLIVFEKKDKKTSLIVRRYNENSGELEIKKIFEFDDDGFQNIIEHKKKLDEDYLQIEKNCKNFLEDLKAEKDGVQAIIFDVSLFKGEKDK